MTRCVPGNAKPGRLASNSLHRRWVFCAVCCLLIFVLIVSIVVAVSIGTVYIPFFRVIRIILWHVEPSCIAPDWLSVDNQIVWMMRLPRSLMAGIVGAGLAICGAALQAMARNPLADPYIFGVSSGASVGAVAVLTLGAGAVGSPTLTIAAFTGALVAMGLVFLFAQDHGCISPLRLVLAGVALSYSLSAVTSFLILRISNPGWGVASVLHWLAGSLGRARWEGLPIPALVFFGGFIYLILHARQLNALMSGDETATSLGVNVERFRIQLFVITSLLVGVLVASCGAIGFMGLMAPHIARMMVGADHSKMIVVAALLGGASMPVIDLLGRILIAPIELPVGIVTAMVGGPFFLWLLRNRMQTQQG